MNGLTLVVDFIVKPEKEKEVVAALKGLVEPTRQEKGCLYYAFYKDIKNQHQYTMIERWESKEDWDKHDQSAHVQQALPLVQEGLVDMKLRKFVDVTQ